jgi:DNA helicase HerA-like ATPase
MVEYYKENLQTGTTAKSVLDQFTRYEFSFSGLRCSVLGCFYKDATGKIRLGADLENFYSAHNYSVIKPNADVLSFIVNYRESGIPGGEGDVRIGKVRYSSSRRFQDADDEVPVYVKATDFAGRRTGLFGMTRTGKSNTIKKIIQAIEEMSLKAPCQLDKSKESESEILKPFTDSNAPKYPIGQIVFDINGEYANPNLQDEGTAIADLYKSKTVLYSVLEKPGFKVLKVNFYNEVANGFELVKEYPRIRDDETRFITNFRSVLLEKPDDYSDHSVKTRHDRKVAVYLCILYKAGFSPPPGIRISFAASKEVRQAVDPEVDLTSGLTLEEATRWWTRLWDVYDSDGFKKQKTGKPRKGQDSQQSPVPPEPQESQESHDSGEAEGAQKEWADDDLKSLLVMLTRRRTSTARAPDCAGYLVLREVAKQHTSAKQMPFEQDILNCLRGGKIVIVDLSMGDEALQQMFSKRISKHIFRDAMGRFTETQPNNFVQFYFEEAHNLFPKKDDKDLSQIYSRIAKEGAKLNLGLVFATQELSSISGNILKNTQNWFVSHLNNEEEIRELRKYYDFSDFSEGLIRFSQDTDKGFVRMKSYSNAFVVPVQVDRFAPKG